MSLRCPWAGGSRQMLHDGTCSVHALLNIMIIIIITIMIEVMAILITMMTLFSSNMKHVSKWYPYNNSDTLEKFETAKACPCIARLFGVILKQDRKGIIVYLFYLSLSRCHLRPV